MSYATYGKIGKKSTEKEVELNGNVFKITNMEDKKSILLQATKTNTLLVIDINAKWCGPCKRVAPAYHDLSLKYPNVIFAEEDVDLGMSPDVTGVPCFKFYSGLDSRGIPLLLTEVQGADLNKVEGVIAEYTQTQKETGEKKGPPSKSSHPHYGIKM